MARRKKTSSKNLFEIFESDDENVEENGLIGGDVEFSKDAVATFSFANDTADLSTPNIQSQSEAAPENKNEIKELKFNELIDNRKQQTQPYGITPPVAGEHFEVSRTFKFRRSTVRLLNRLKAEHQDENAYLSSIVDEAIRYYYEHIFQ
jgi:hypothetical protein